MDPNDKRKAITGHPTNACEIISKHYENMKVVGGMICVQEEEQRIQIKPFLLKNVTVSILGSLQTVIPDHIAFVNI